MKEMTKNGVFGDPTLASKNKGIKISELVLEGLQRIAVDLKNAK